MLPLTLFQLNPYFVIWEIIPKQFINVIRIYSKHLNHSNHLTHSNQNTSGQVTLAIIIENITIFSTGVERPHWPGIG